MRIFRLAFAILLVASTMLALVGIPGRAHAQSNAQDGELARLMDQLTGLTKDGKLVEAEAVARKLVAKAERMAGKEHELTAFTLFALGQNYMLQGKLDDAETTFNRVLAIREKTLGPNHAEVANALNQLGSIAVTRGRYTDGERLIQRALAIAERALEPDHHDTAMIRVTLARIRHVEARYGEAEALFERALASLRKSQLPPAQIMAATVVNNLAVVAQDQGKLALAETRAREAIAIQEKLLGAESLPVSTYLNNLAEVHVRQGRYAEAESLHRRSLQIVERILGPDHPEVATGIANLASSLTYQGRAEEAVGLQRRALAIIEKARGPRHPDAANVLNNIAYALAELGRTREAEELFRRSLAVREAALGPEHALVASSLANIAGVMFQERRYEEAVPLARRSLAIRQKALGSGHPVVAESFNALGMVLNSLKLNDEAAPLLRDALAMREAALGSSHPDVAVSLNNLGGLQLDQGQWREAYATFKRAYAIWLGRRSATTGAADEGRRIESRSGSIDPYMGVAVAAYHMAEGASRDVALGLRAEAFEAAQWTGAASASVAITRMAARTAAGGGPLGEAVREQQDLVEQAAAIDRALIALMSQPSQQRTSSALDTLRRQGEAVAQRLKAVDTNLAFRFPQYAALVSAGPVSLRDLSGLLRVDEALLMLVPTRTDVYVWAVTRETSRWVKAPLDREQLREHVAALRCGFDVVGAWSGEGARRCMELLRLSAQPGPAELAPFDLGRAYTLYRALFEDVADLIAGKRLLIVPTGPLSSLPFHALVTEPPPGLAEAVAQDYAGVAWLARRHAISVLPSVGSLRALRTLARQSQAKAPFIGFGNPLLTGADDTDRRAWERLGCAPSPAPTADAGRRSLPTAMLMRGGFADVGALRRQPPLPETADELCAVARLLGAPEKAVQLGAAATERRIKALSANGVLREVRFLHFATHGLLAAETSQVVRTRAEPALMLTPPTRPSEEDDGLLTASEIAQLKLDADWVILSACNTAASEELAPGLDPDLAPAINAEVLSGLARAFFYAGSRALLASHWYVDSEAAVALVTGSFAELKRDPALGRAEALRRAMLALVARGGRMAHPASWAPFVVVGEGA